MFGTFRGGYLGGDVIPSTNWTGTPHRVHRNTNTNATTPATDTTTEGLGVSIDIVLWLSEFFPVLIFIISAMNFDAIEKLFQQLDDATDNEPQTPLPLVHAWHHDVSTTHPKEHDTMVMRTVCAMIEALGPSFPQLAGLYAYRTLLKDLPPLGTAVPSQIEAPVACIALFDALEHGKPLLHAKFHWIYTWHLRQVLARKMSIRIDSIVFGPTILGPLLEEMTQRSSTNSPDPFYVLYNIHRSGITGYLTFGYR